MGIGTAKFLRLRGLGESRDREPPVPDPRSKSAIRRCNQIRTDGVFRRRDTYGKNAVTARTSASSPGPSTTRWYQVALRPSRAQPSVPADDVEVHESRAGGWWGHARFIPWLSTERVMSQRRAKARVFDIALDSRPRPGQVGCDSPGGRDRRHGDDPRPPAQLAVGDHER